MPPRLPSSVQPQGSSSPSRLPEYISGKGCALTEVATAKVKIKKFINPQIVFNVTLLPFNRIF
jgi:hypothetical protein